MDLVVVNGLVVTADAQFKADVLCRQGRISAIGDNLFRQGMEKIDAAGCYVLPGGIDAHVHLQMPVGDLVSTDDFGSGTAAAACGGTTTIVDFATPERGQALEEAVRLRRAEADGQAAIDYGLHLALVDDSEETLAALPGLVRAGYSSFKIYTVYDGLYLEDPAILRLLQVAAEQGVTVLVHGENRAIVDYCTQRLLQAGHSAPRYHPQARPAAAEAEGAARVMALAQVTGATLCIAHVSCEQVLEEVRRARARGQAVHAETCPHYLLLTQEEYERPGFEGAKYVLTPPLRSEVDREALWQALAAGEFQQVSTDHCPWNYAAQKERGRENFALIPNGAAGIETRLPLLWSEGVGRGRLSPEQFVQLTASGPARAFGLYPRKGVLAPGADADIVVWDPHRRLTLRAADLHQRVDYCPYEGWPVQGYPRDVFLRGRPLVRGGQFVGEPGGGRFVERSSQPA
ncbi:MAG: dihydropyrimidinase [Chloroflexia bacterium]|nr:dihydropyrimidinase [Chloroflexia bacterium]